MTIDEPSHQHSADSEDPGPRREGRMPLYGWGIIALSVVGIGIYLVVDHWPHVLAALPYLGIIAIVTMHMFGHGGHGGHRGSERASLREQDPPRNGGDPA